MCATSENYTAESHHCGLEGPSKAQLPNSNNTAVCGVAGVTNKCLETFFKSKRTSVDTHNATRGTS